MAPLGIAMLLVQSNIGIICLIRWPLMSYRTGDVKQMCDKVGRTTTLQPHLPSITIL